MRTALPALQHGAAGASRRAAPRGGGARLLSAASKPLLVTALASRAATFSTGRRPSSIPAPRLRLAAGSRTLCRVLAVVMTNKAQKQFPIGPSGGTRCLLRLISTPTTFWWFA